VELDLHSPTCLHGELRDGFTFLLSLRYPSSPIYYFRVKLYFDSLSSFSYVLS